MVSLATMARRRGCDQTPRVRPSSPLLAYPASLPFPHPSNVSLVLYVPSRRILHSFLNFLESSSICLSIWYDLSLSPLSGAEGAHPILASPHGVGGEEMEGVEECGRRDWGLGPELGLRCVDEPGGRVSGDE